MAHPNPVVMPHRGVSSAPRFDDEKKDIEEFFDDVEYLASICTTKPLDEDLITITVMYTTKNNRELWTSLGSHPTKLAQNVAVSFNAWKKEVLSLYPSANDARKYSIYGLETLADKSAAQGIHNKADFGEYYRNFLRISNSLLINDRLTKRELHHTFLRGFQQPLRDQIVARCLLVDLDHLPDDPFGLPALKKAVDHLLACTSSESSATDCGSTKRRVTHQNRKYRRRCYPKCFRAADESLLSCHS